MSNQILTRGIIGAFATAVLVWGATVSAAGDNGISRHEMLRKAAEDKNLKIALPALEALAKAGDPNDADLFLKRADDEDWHIRQISISALASIGTEEGDKALTAALWDLYPSVVEAAIDGVVKRKIGDAAGALTGLLDTPSIGRPMTWRSVQRKAARALVALGDQSLDELTALLNRRPHKIRQAASLLLTIDTKASRKAYVDAFLKAGWRRRSGMLHAARKQLLPRKCALLGLRDDHPFVRRMAALAVASNSTLLSDPNLLPLVVIHGSEGTVHSAIRSARKVTDHSDTLIQAIETVVSRADLDQAIAIDGIRLLGRDTSEAASGALLRLTEKLSDGKVRAHLVRELGGRTASKAVVSRLLEIVADSDDYDTLQHALRALPNRAKDQVIKVATRRVKHPGQTPDRALGAVRQWLVEETPSTAEELLLPQFRKHLKDGSESDGREHITKVSQMAMLLGRLGTDGAIEVLHKGLDAPSDDVQIASAMALSGMRNLKDLNVLLPVLLHDKEELRKSACRAVSRQIRPRDLPALTRAMKDVDLARLDQATLVLTRVSFTDDPNLAAPLMCILSKKAETRTEQDSQARVAETLARMSSLAPGATEPLTVLAKDRSHPGWLAAARALAGIGTKDAIQALNGILVGVDDDRQRAAILQKLRQATIEPKAADVLREMHKKLQNARDRLAVSMAIAQADPNSSLELLLADLKAVPTYHNRKLLDALKDSSETNAVRAVETVMLTGDLRTRIAAMQLLMQIGDETTAEKLRKLLKDGPSQTLRKLADNALKQIRLRQDARKRRKKQRD